MGIGAWTCSKFIVETPVRAPLPNADAHLSPSSKHLKDYSPQQPVLVYTKDSPAPLHQRIAECPSALHVRIDANAKF